MISASSLYVFTARSNPVGWNVPHAHWRRFAKAMLDAGVHLTVVECAYGEEDFRCADDGARHIGVRAKTRGWIKENLLNLGIQRTPEADYIAWIDADVIFRRADWAEATVRALQHYDIVQPWSDAYDLGPNGEHMAVHRSFCRQLFHREPVVPTAPDFWATYTYPHCLPGDSVVVPGGEIIAASRRPYEGDLVVIRTASGEELSCSPNHPVFSGAGWVRADRLKVGDNVLRHIRGNGMLGKPDEKHVPARIEDIVRACGERTGANRFTCLLPDDLDNHRSNSKVAEVWADRGLPAESHPGSGKSRGDLRFGGIGQLAAGGFDRLGALDHFGETFGFPAAPDGAARAAGTAAVFRRGFAHHASTDRHADLLTAFSADALPRFTPAEGSNLSGSSGLGVGRADIGSDAGSDDLARIPFVHADNPGALRRALAGQIEPDQIVYVGRREFSGHLYDLQTENGYIIADGILTHNSGYAWAITRDAYDRIGGLFELGGMGSGDHHMALALIGHADASMPGGTGDAYRAEVKRWEARAVRHINGNIGYVPGTIEHLFHGRKIDRAYETRWQMFVQHGFDPLDDLKRNSHGVFEFAQNKPELRHDFDLYLHARNEDINALD